MDRTSVTRGDAVRAQKAGLTVRAIGVPIHPKRLRATDEEDGGVVRIGASRKTASGRPVDIQLRLSPHPDFATVEVLYLWRFGGLPSVPMKVRQSTA